MILHYSVRYKGDPIPCHGEVVFPYTIPSDHTPYQKAMVNTVKIDLYKSQELWGKQSEDMEAAEFYYHVDEEGRNDTGKGEEVVFFKWGKE